MTGIRTRTTVVPCPPIGRHRYEFMKLYALDTVLKGLNTPTKVKVEAAMRGHVIAVPLSVILNTAGR